MKSGKEKSVECRVKKKVTSDQVISDQKVESGDGKIKESDQLAL